MEYLVHVNRCLNLSNVRAERRKEEEAKQPTSERLRDVLHAGLRPGPQQGVHGHHHARGAEATLRAVSLRYSLLHTQIRLLASHTSSLDT